MGRNLKGGARYVSVGVTVTQMACQAVGFKRYPAEREVKRAIDVQSNGPPKSSCPNPQKP